MAASSSLRRDSTGWAASRVDAEVWQGTAYHCFASPGDLTAGEENTMPRFSDRTVDVANHAIDALPRHPPQSTALLRALRCCDRAPTRRQRLLYLIALLTCKSWMWLVLSLMLSSQVVAGELSFTVSHLE